MEGRSLEADSIGFHRLKILKPTECYVEGRSLEAESVSSAAKDGFKLTESSQKEVLGRGRRGLGPTLTESCGTP